MIEERRYNSRCDAAGINLGLISSPRTVPLARDDHGSRGERRYQFQLSNRDAMRANGKSSEGYERSIKEAREREKTRSVGVLATGRKVNFNKTLLAAQLRPTCRFH